MSTFNELRLRFMIVLGAISFLAFAVPLTSFAAVTINQGDSVNLYWTIVGPAPSCVKSGGIGSGVEAAWAGPPVATNANADPSLAADGAMYLGPFNNVGTFTFVCTAAPNPPGTDSVTVMVGAVTSGSFGAFSAPECLIPSGASTCSAGVSWNIVNPTSPSVRQNGVQFSTAASNPGISRTIAYGTPPGNTFTLVDGATTLDTKTPSAACVGGTTWNGSICAPPTASFTSTPACVIASGAAGCNTTVAWTSSDVAAVNLTDCGGGVYTLAAPAGPGSRSVFVPAFSGCYQIRETSTGNVLAQTVPNVTSSCIAGTTWDGVKCAPATGSFTIAPTNCTIPVGGNSCTTNVAWSITSPISPSVRQDGVQFSVAPSSGGTIRTMPQGSHTFDLYDNGVSLTPTITVTASCPALSPWNGTMCNAAPTAPTISGPLTGSISTNYTFTFQATDPDSNILYQVDWENNGWGVGVDQTLPAAGYVVSGTALSQANNWAGPGVKTFQARTVDQYGATSAWTPFTITIGQAGVCAPTHYNCSVGTSINNVSGASWTWTCQGLFGGGDVSCSEVKTVIMHVTPPPGPRSFSATPLGNTSTLDFQVTNLGDPGSELTGVVSSSDPRFTCILGCNYTALKPGDAPWLVRIQFQPDSVALFSSNIGFTGGNPDATFPVVVTGQGLAPITFVTDPLSFGDVPVTKSADRTITITNISSVNLGATTVSTVPVAGGAFTCTAGCNFTLAPGVPNVVTIHYVPGALGPASATGVLSGQAWTFSINGNGVAAAFNVKER